MEQKEEVGTWRHGIETKADGSHNAETPKEEHEHLQQEWQCFWYF